MATAADPDDDIAERVREGTAATPISSRQSAEAIGLLVAVLLILLSLALTVGAPARVGG